MRWYGGFRMGGILLLLGFIACGVVIIDGLLPNQFRLARCWLGTVAGLGLMMWLPALYAFALRFTLTAQLLGLATAALLAGSGSAPGAGPASAAGRTCRCGCRWRWCCR